MTNGMHFEEYLGDGLYVGFDGYHIVLWTSDGINTTNKVFLDQDVSVAFAKWQLHLAERIKLEQERRNGAA